MTEQEFAIKQADMLADIPKAFHDWMLYQAWEICCEYTLLVSGHTSGYEEMLIHLDDLIEGFNEALSKYESKKQTHDHLTDEQKTEIRQEAVCATFEDAQQDNYYLLSLIEGWIDTMNLEDQIHAISGDPDMLPELLGFDPETGKEWVYE